MAGCPIPRSFATAEKLPFSTARPNICIASNLSTAASIFLFGMDAMRGRAIQAFLLGMACIPKSTKTPGDEGTSHYQGDDMAKLNKKVALVTGGSRGIGAAIAKRLAADGASVAITYAKDASAASAVVKAIEQDGGKAIAIQADAADAEAAKAAVEKVFATFGRLDVLVNNAGTAIPKTFEETTLEEMDRVIDINIRGVFATTQAALKHMNDGGRVIMIGSAVGERA